MEHPKQMLEEDDLATDNGDGVVVIVAGALHELAEDGVVDDVGAHQVAAARLADVDGAEGVSGSIDHVVYVVVGILVIGRRVASGGGNDGGGAGEAAELAE